MCPFHLVQFLNEMLGNRYVQKPVATPVQCDLQFHTAEQVHGVLPVEAVFREQNFVRSVELVKQSPKLSRR